VPLAALHKYATELRSLTQGRGTYTLRFCHYEEVPEKTARQLIEAARERKEK
jgi:translation elongation factor G